MLDPSDSPAGEVAPFIDTVAMEQDPDQCFAGDRGTLAPEVRHVLVRLLQRRFLLADRHSDEWAVLLEHQPVIESRLHDMFVRLVVDQGRGVAYKQQVRSEEIDVPILLRDEAYTRSETLVLVYLRTVYQRESTVGEPSVRVDVEEIEQTVLTYFTAADGDVARRQKAVRAALARLRQEGIITEESEGRYLVSSLVEIVLSADRLRELSNWLRAQTAAAGAGDASVSAGAEPPADTEFGDTSTNTINRGDLAS
ncbi:hypothetical protein JOF28_000652 [Leucobacter exalbidus]|uniref:DUF4194 domain-containing protein n=1 Tax=Leucobacter exalbidus TaxID=662960 RepID=A0A940PLP7_9MICO|nr:DUF4194 domain-containing protein [Leucobacter exalbidus]MBP1325420.1 hypothetical protein [Leucobacter exalbidus]